MPDIDYPDNNDEYRDGSSQKDDEVQESSEREVFKELKSKLELAESLESSQEVSETIKKAWLTSAEMSVLIPIFAERGSLLFNNNPL